MDDMQSRIAARRAELERKSRGDFGNPDADMSDIFEGLFGAGQASTDAGNVGGAPAQGQGDNQALPPKPGTEGKVQDRVAARRAEIEGERARAAAATRAAADARRAEEKAAAELEWAERARQEKARLDSETPDGGPVDPARKAAMDRMLREAVRKRWTSNQWTGFGMFVAAGVLLLGWQPVWGAIVLLIGAGSYAAVNSTHRDAVLKDYPDLFAPASARKEP